MILSCFVSLSISPFYNLNAEARTQNYNANLKLRTTLVKLEFLGYKNDLLKFLKSKLFYVFYKSQ